MSPTLWIILILVVVAGLIAAIVVVVRVSRETDQILTFDFGSNVFSGEDIEDAFEQSGNLPYSRAFEGRLVRWHAPQLLWCGDKFYRTFEDGPWKWDSRQRYAGAGINCGHYFSLSERGADAEYEHYNLVKTNHELLDVHVRLDSVLDLTYEVNIREVVRHCLSVREEFFNRPVMSFLSMLIDIEEGGTELTDYIGHWARRQGYDGILFFGARAIAPVREIIRDGRDFLMGVNHTPMRFREYRADESYQNLMVFSGPHLVTRILSYSTPSIGAHDNSYWGCASDELDKLLEFDEYYQLERSTSFALIRPWLEDDKGNRL